MRRGTLVRAGAAWAFAVVVVAAICWGAIAAAGDQLAPRPSVPAGVDRGAPTPSPTAGDTASPVPTSPVPSASSTSPSDRPTVRETSTAPPVRPRVTVTPTPPASPSGTKPVDPSPGTPSPVPEIVRSTRGGTAAFSCDGDAIVYRVRPADGWRAEVAHEPKGEIEVRFIRNDDRIAIEASCLDGRPVASDEQHAEGSHSDD